MSKFYSAEHRKLQDEFGTRRLADLMEGGVMHTEFAPPPHEIEFIQSRDMFFLSTVDPAGRPTVSYKGGAQGFVRVEGPGALAFPWYDGNGMFYSAGKLSETHKVGLLFIDFVTPNRLRVQGEARIIQETSLLSARPGAQFLVSVEVESIWGASESCLCISWQSAALVDRILHNEGVHQFDAIFHIFEFCFIRRPCEERRFPISNDDVVGVREMLWRRRAFGFCLGDFVPALLLVGLPKFILSFDLDRLLSFDPLM